MNIEIIEMGLFCLLGWVTGWIITYLLLRRSNKNGWVGLFKPNKEG